jgi:hypothetical protein
LKVAVQRPDFMALPLYIQYRPRSQPGTWELQRRNGNGSSELGRRSSSAEEPAQATDGARESAPARVAIGNSNHSVLMSTRLHLQGTMKKETACSSRPMAQGYQTARSHDPKDRTNDSVGNASGLPRSNLDYPHWDFKLFFPQYLQINARTVTKIGERPLPSTSFSIHYWLTTHCTIWRYTTSASDGVL